MLITQRLRAFKNGGGFIFQGELEEQNDDVIYVENITRQASINRDIGKKSFKNLYPKHHKRAIEKIDVSLYGKIDLQRDGEMLTNERNHLGLGQTDSFQSSCIHKEYMDHHQN